MSEKKIVANNVIYLTIAELIGRIFQFFFYKHITVALGAEAFGSFSWSITNISYFFIILGAGLDIYGIREISKDKSKLSYFSNLVLSLRLFLSIIAFIAILIYSFYLPKSDEIKLLLVLAGFRLFGDAILPNWVYQAIEKMSFVALRNFLINFLNLILAYLLIKSPEDVFYAVSLISFNICLTAFLLLLHFNFKIQKINLFFNLKQFINVLKSSIPIGISIQIIIFYNSADIVMLGFLRENFEYEVGIYSAAMRIILISTLPIQILQQAFFPKFSNDNFIDSDSYYRKFSLISAFIGIFLTFVVVNYSYDIIRIQFSDIYYESSILLKILGLKLFFSYLTITFSIPFLAKHKENFILFSVGSAFILNIILNYFAIPIFGIYGAAYSTIFCEFIILIVFVYLMSKTYSIFYIKPIIYCVILFFSLQIIFVLTNQYLGLNIYLSFLFSIFTFFIMTILLKVLSINEIKAILRR